VHYLLIFLLLSCLIHIIFILQKEYDNTLSLEELNLQCYSKKSKIPNANRGLFVKCFKPAGSIICSLGGIFISPDFFQFYDYDISYVSINNNEITVDSKDSKDIGINMNDPLDEALVNSIIVDVADYGVVVKNFKPINPDEEVLVSYGKIFWMHYFRKFDSIGPNIANLRMKAFKNYKISQDEARQVGEQKVTNMNIALSLQKYKYWKSGGVLGGGLENFNNSCFMNATLQCLAHIPSLTRMLLEHEYFRNMPVDNFLSRYIEVLKLLFKSDAEYATLRDFKNETVQSAAYKKQFVADKKDCMKWISVRRHLLNKGFIPGIHQDAEEFLTELLNKFCNESKEYNYLHHLLFHIYSDDSKICDNNHVSTKRRVETILSVELEDPTESKTYKLIELINNTLAKKKQDKPWLCPKCRKENKVSFTQTAFFKLPEILIIQIKRWKTTKNKLGNTDTSLLSNYVEYERFMTLNDYQNNDVHYELNSFIVFDGEKNASLGHYYALVLHPNKYWYKLDDKSNPEVQTIRSVLDEKSKAYIFFYNRIKGTVTNEVADLFVDSYGCHIGSSAVALHLPIDADGRPMPKTLLIISKFQNFIKNNPKKHIVDFIKELEIYLHFWRYLRDDITLKKSCLSNGLSGYQLDYLLHERLCDNSTLPDHKDRYIYNENYKISAPQTFSYFKMNMRNKATLPKFFPNIKKPTISTNTNKKKNNKTVYSSYEDWIYQRNQLYKSKELDENAYFEELYFYKCYKANDWIEDNCKTYAQFYVNKYPQSIRIRNLLIPLDFDIHMFNQFFYLL